MLRISQNYYFSRENSRYHKLSLPNIQLFHGSNSKICVHLWNKLLSELPAYKCIAQLTQIWNTFTEYVLNWTYS